MAAVNLELAGRLLLSQNPQVETPNGSVYDLQFRREGEWAVFEAHDFGGARVGESWVLLKHLATVTTRNLMTAFWSCLGEAVEQSVKLGKPTYFLMDPPGGQPA